MSLKKVIVAKVQKQIKHYEDFTAAMKKDLDDFSRGKGPLTFEIYIHSLWADQGEKSITYVKRGSLKTAMNEANQIFKETNRRSDVQGSYLVWTVLPSGNKVEVPEKYFLGYKDH